MVWGLYHFSVAYDKGKATDPVKYFADPKNQDLGVVKYLRKTEQKIDLSPNPCTQLPPAQFHHPNLKTQTAHHLNLSRMLQNQQCASFFAHVGGTDYDLEQQSRAYQLAHDCAHLQT